MAEWSGRGLQNLVRQFDSAWRLPRLAIALAQAGCPGGGTGLHGGLKIPASNGCGFESHPGHLKQNTPEKGCFGRTCPIGVPQYMFFVCQTELLQNSLQTKYPRIPAFSGASCLLR